MSLRNRFVLIPIVLLLVLGTVGLLFYLNLQGGYLGKFESITIGNAQSFECDTLVYLAQDQDFLVQNGLNVSIMNYTSGMAAVNDLLKGSIDIAATAEFPLVRHALNGENISALTCIGKFQLQDLIGRKDRGIERVSDLRGKTIGVPLGTISEFYIGRFLQLNGMRLGDVTIVNVNAAESVELVVNGTVDALVIWQPYAYSAEELLGDNASVFPVQSNQRLSILEVARNSWIAQNPDLVNRFVKSLAQAEEYYMGNSVQATAMMQESLNYTDAYIAEIWDKNEYSLSLDQSLILALEEEARWAINNNLTEETRVPDFLSYIYVDSLKSIQPESVNIIR